MPAYYESGFQVGEPAWHGLGHTLPVDTILSVSQALKLSGLDWGVEMRPVVTVQHVTDAIEHNNPVQVDCPFEAIVRTDNNRVLGVATSKYQPFQNSQLFEWFSPYVEADEARFHTAGSLQGGQKVWALAKINRANTEIVRGDEIAKFLLLSNSHDGKSAIRIGFTPIRVVCANTLAIAFSSSQSKLLRVRHSVRADNNLEAIRDMINLVNQEFEATAEQYRYLASQQINSNDLRKYVKLVLGLEDTDDSELKTRSRNIIDEIIGLTEVGIGQDNPNVSGTYWAAYNGVTEYLNYRRGHNANTRLDSLWFGPSATINQRALTVALEMSA